MATQASSAPTRGRSAPARRAVRRTPIVLFLVVAVLAWAGPAAAASPDHFRFPDVRSFSFVCPAGFQVDVIANGFVDVTLFRDATGAVTREVDKIQTHFDIRSPDTGKGWSDVWSNTLTFDFAAGTVVGAPVTITIRGSFMQHIPGLGTDGGRRVLEGTYLGEEDGIPIVEYNFDDPDPVFSAGRHPGLDLCDALS
jgi:hypothetical protein